MNMRSLIQVEVEKEGRLYYFFMPERSPYGDAIEACKMAAEDINNLYEQAKKNRKDREKESAEDKKEE